MSKKLFYQIISRILDPLILTPLSILLLAYKFNLDFSHIIILLGVQIILPVIYFFIGLYLGKYDIDLTDRKKRAPILIVVLITQCIALLLTNSWGYLELVKVQSLLLIINGIFLLVTLNWKISGHALANILFINILMIYFSPYYFLLGLITIPIVFASRVYLHKHTPAQLIAGSVLGMTMLILYFI